MKRFRVYADTSVFGGCFDDEFAEESRAFFEMIRSGRFTLLISPTVLAELQRAPEQVRRIIPQLPADAVEKIAGYQAVNLLNGYREIRIYSPKEVVANEG